MLDKRFLAILLGRVLDIVTTLYNINFRGHVEANPIMARLVCHPPLFVIAQVICAFSMYAVALAWERLAGEKIAWIYVGFSYLPVINNIGIADLTWMFRPLWNLL